MSIGNVNWKNGKVDCSINTGQGKTKQAFKNECDINKIIKRLEKGGMVATAKKKGFYGDVSEIGDLRSAMEKIDEANEMFAGMSSDIRRRFNNNPAEMIEFLANSENKQEAIDLGMIVEEPKEVATPPVVP